MNEKNAKAYYKRGLTLDNLERYEEAIENFTKAIDLDYKDENIYYNRGTSRSLIRDLEGAKNDLTTALEYNKDEFKNIK